MPGNENEKFLKYKARILAINTGDRPDVLTRDIVVPEYRGYRAGDRIPAGTPLSQIIDKEFNSVAPTHTITIQVMGQGTTDPSGNQTVEEGQRFVFNSATPASGWRLKSLTLDGAAITAPHTISNVTGPHTIKAEFEEIPEELYTVNVTDNTPSSLSNYGTVYPTAGSHTYPAGQELTVSATPNTGFVIKTFTVNGTDVTGTYTLRDAEIADGAVNNVIVEFEEAPEDLYHVTVEDNTTGLTDYGTIVPGVGTHDYSVGTDSNVVATPASGFKIKSFKVNNVEQTITDPTQAFTHQITGVAKDVTITVTVEFEEIQLSIVESFIRSTRSGAIVDPTPENIANDAVVTNKTQAELDDMVANNYQWPVNAPANYCIPVFMYPTTMPDIVKIEYLDGDEQAFTKGTMTYSGVDYKWIRWNNKMNSGSSPRVIKWN